MIKSIRNFTIIYNIENKNFQIQIDHKIIKEIKNSENYIIGYQYKNNGFNDGEYIKLCIEKEKITLENDRFSAYPVYLYRDAKEVILANTIEGLTTISDTKISINSDLIYEYFTFGYIPFQSKITYNNISLIEPNTIVVIDKKVSIKSIPSEIFNHKKPFNNVDLLYSVLNESIINKTRGFTANESVFCMSSGQDSLLGSCLFKKNGISTSTATFGKSNSKDILIAKERANILSLGRSHHECIIDHFNFNIRSFQKLSLITGGLSPSSNIYLYLFTSYIKNLGYRLFYYCDHYEAFRRSLKTEVETIYGHTTPLKVVKKYFIDLDTYKTKIAAAASKIYDIYVNDPYMEYYLFEKYIKMTFYKNVIHNELGTQKITLPLDYNLLRFNNNYINTTKKYSFERIASKVQNEISSDFKFSETKLKTPSDFCYEPRMIIKQFKEDFIEIINCEIGNGLENYFDLNKMIKSIKVEDYVEKEEWFILRLINFMIFKRLKNIAIR